MSKGMGWPEDVVKGCAWLAVGVVLVTYIAAFASLWMFMASSVLSAR